MLIVQENVQAIPESPEVLMKVLCQPEYKYNTGIKTSFVLVL